MTALLDVFATVEDLARSAAAGFADLAQETVRRRGRFIVVLSGGATPLRLYQVLAETSGPGRAVPWQAAHVCWGDERHVPPEHRDSNYRAADAALLQHVPIPPAHVHRIRAEDPDADTAARHYEEELRSLFGSDTGGVPAFDLLLLGMGPDGHTASLFPGSAALRETSRLVVAPWVKSLAAYRITLSPPVLLNAEETMVLVAGREKAATLGAVLEGPMGPERFPAQLLRGARGRVRWLIDREAASALQGR